MSGLPKCMHKRGPSYYLVKNNKWHNLGRNLEAALGSYAAALSGKEQPFPVYIDDPSLVQYANFPMPLDKIIDGAVAQPKAGIYFLLQDSDIVYVGQSTNILARLGSHSHGMSGCFNRYFYIECNESNLNEWEGRYIRDLRPKHNRRIPIS